MSIIFKGFGEFFAILTGWTTKNFKLEDVPSLEDKTVIVTGASAGLGLTATVEMAKKGAHV
jgi:NADPH:quinone reductase-like Zn-dependent oxidoreductase